MIKAKLITAECILNLLSSRIYLWGGLSPSWSTCDSTLRDKVLWIEWISRELPLPRLMGVFGRVLPNPSGRLLSNVIISKMSKFFFLMRVLVDLCNKNVLICKCKDILYIPWFHFPLLFALLILTDVCYPSHSSTYPRENATIFIFLYHLLFWALYYSWLFFSSAGAVYCHFTGFSHRVYS